MATRWVSSVVSPSSAARRMPPVPTSLAGPLRLTGNLDGHGAARRCAGAELAVEITAPAVRGAGRGHPAAVVVADGHNSELEPARHRHGYCAAGFTIIRHIGVTHFRSGGRSDAELAATVIPPAVQSAARSDAAGVEATGAHSCKRETSGHCDRGPTGLGV